jgi:hypothetical protein
VPLTVEDVKPVGDLDLDAAAEMAVTMGKVLPFVSRANRNAHEPHRQILHLEDRLQRDLFEQWCQDR